MKNSFNFLRLSEPDKIHACFKVKFLNKSFHDPHCSPKKQCPIDYKGYYAFFAPKIKVLNRAFKVRLIKIIKIRQKIKQLCTALMLMMSRKTSHFKKKDVMYQNLDALPSVFLYQKKPQNQTCSSIIFCYFYCDV